MMTGVGRDVTIVSQPLYNPGSAILVGFPGSGLVGTIALQYLVEQLDFELIGSMTSKYFPPLAMMNKGVINEPVRIYKKDDLTAIVGDIPIHPGICYEISHDILDWLEPFAPREILTIAGIITNESEKRVFGIATTQAALERIQDQTITLSLGTISGIVSSLLTACKIRGIPAYGILGETINTPDPRASAATLQILNKMYNLSVDVSLLIEQAEEIEQSMGRLADEVQQSAESAPKKDLIMYG